MFSKEAKSRHLNLLKVIAFELQLNFFTILRSYILIDDEYLQVLKNIYNYSFGSDVNPILLTVTWILLLRKEGIFFL